MKNFKRYGVALAVATSLALSGCTGGSDSGNPTAPPDNDVDYTTVGKDRALVEYINPDDNSFKITWYKESTGSSELELKDSQDATGFFVVFARVNPGTGVMECQHNSSSSTAEIFLCNKEWIGDDGKRVVSTGFSMYFRSDNYAEVIAKYFRKEGGTLNAYYGEIFGTLEWTGTQLIVN